MKFEIGEVVIYVRPGPNYGKEVTITSELQSTLLWSSYDDSSYVEDAHMIDGGPNFVLGPYHVQGRQVASPPRYLRKKDDDSWKAGSWSDSAWKPQGVIIA